MSVRRRHGALLTLAVSGVLLGGAGTVWDQRTGDEPAAAGLTPATSSAVFDGVVASVAPPVSRDSGDASPPETVTGRDLGTVRGTLRLSGPRSAPAGTVVRFQLIGPERAAHVDRTAPYAWTVDTRDLPDGRYRARISTVSPDSRPAVVEMRLRIDNGVRTPSRSSRGDGRAPADPPASALAPPQDASPQGPGTRAQPPATAPSERPNRATTQPDKPEEPEPSDPSEPGTSPPDSDEPSFAAQVVELTNEERAREGCDELVADPVLTSVAQAHSADMAEHDYFSHTGRDGRSPFDRMSDAGYEFSRAAENIAAGHRTPADVVERWMDSSGHRANILNCALTEIGVGYATGGSYGTYWTQNFGTPKQG